MPHDTGVPDVGVPDPRGLGAALAGDGRPLLTFTALALLLSGGFALFISAAGQFLPHDIAFLGMSAEQLCALADCRVVAFMFHDRVAFGGALIAVAVLYLWLAEFPLRRGEAWAWWTFAITGFFGFASFLAYLGYGYLDSWHGAGTLVMLPLFILGLAVSYPTVRPPRGPGSLLRRGDDAAWSSRPGLARAFLLATAAGMVTGGATILGVGMTHVFVPQDLAFMGMDAADLTAANPRLIPLIAHDRAGFGGGLAATGLTVGLCAWCARPGRALWQALFLSGLAGFGCAIGVHLVVGYVDLVHLAPAVLGAGLFVVGIALAYRPMVRGRAAPGATRSNATAPAPEAEPHARFHAGTPLERWIGGAIAATIRGWVRVTGRRVAKADAPWLDSPTGPVGRIGAEFYDGLAGARGLEIRREPRAGLLPDFDVLAGPGFDPSRVHPTIRDFYEHTADYRLDAWSEAGGAMRPFLGAITRFVSRPMDQLNVPVSSLDLAHGMASDILPMVRADTGERVYTGWLRRLPGLGRVLYTGLYATTRPPDFTGPCVRVSFPVPRGSATVVLRPEAGDDGSFRLISDGRRFGQPGFYRLVETDPGHWRARFIRPLRERFELYVDRAGLVRCDHTLTLHGLTVFRLHYRMEPAGAPAMAGDGSG